MDLRTVVVCRRSPGTSRFFPIKAHLVPVRTYIVDISTKNVPIRTTMFLSEHICSDRNTLIFQKVTYFRSEMGKISHTFFQHASLIASFSRNRILRILSMYIGYFDQRTVTNCKILVGKSKVCLFSPFAAYF